ncbi:hypothetical protein F4811DRAFT_532970, partial [Daldinia bambusicola]
MFGSPTFWIGILRNYFSHPGVSTGETLAACNDFMCVGKKLPVPTELVRYGRMRPLPILHTTRGTCSASEISIALCYNLDSFYFILFILLPFVKLIRASLSSWDYKQVSFARASNSTLSISIEIASLSPLNCRSVLILAFSYEIVRSLSRYSHNKNVCVYSSRRFWTYGLVREISSGITSVITSVRQTAYRGRGRLCLGPEYFCYLIALSGHHVIVCLIPANSGGICCH